MRMNRRKWLKKSAAIGFGSLGLGTVRGAPEGANLPRRIIVNLSISAAKTTGQLRIGGTILRAKGLTFESPTQGKTCQLGIRKSQARMTQSQVRSTRDTLIYR